MLHSRGKPFLKGNVTGNDNHSSRRQCQEGRRACTCIQCRVATALHWVMVDDFDAHIRMLTSRRFLSELHGLSPLNAWVQAGTDGCCVMRDGMVEDSLGVAASSVLSDVGSLNQVTPLHQRRHHL